MNQYMQYTCNTSIILITQCHTICYVLIQNSVTFPSLEFIHEVSSQQHHLRRAGCTTYLALAMAMTHTKVCVFFGTIRCFGTQILSIYYYKIDTNIKKHLLQCNRSVASKTLYMQYTRHYTRNTHNIIYVLHGIIYIQYTKKYIFSLWIIIYVAYNIIQLTSCKC
jgi:hypothetical protein